MKEHNIELTSSEIAHLWTTYQNDSASIAILKYFLAKVEDLEVKQIIEKALKTSQTHIEDLTFIFNQLNYPKPIGFSEEDVNVNAPKLFSDTLMLYFLRNLGKNGLAAYALAFSNSARKDIRELFSKYIDQAKQIEDITKEIMLSKGVYTRPPYIAAPESSSFVEKQGFLKGWFGERRTLTAMEIAHLYFNHQNNALGKALILGFSQIAKSEELKKYFIRGFELARKILDDYHNIFEESSLPTPTTWDTEVKPSTVSPFSDKLMAFLVAALNAISLANIGSSLAMSLRRDIFTKYSKQITEIGLYTEDITNIMIDNEWFERPPQAIDREHLTKGK